ncbi:hypothetical protein ANTRET_LOCUS9245 [Anthophora retusa]
MHKDGVLVHVGKRNGYQTGSQQPVYMVKGKVNEEAAPLHNTRSLFAVVWLVNLEAYRDLPSKRACFLQLTRKNGRPGPTSLFSAVDSHPESLAFKLQPYRQRKKEEGNCTRLEPSC